MTQQSFIDSLFDCTQDAEMNFIAVVEGLIGRVEDRAKDADQDQKGYSESEHVYWTEQAADMRWLRRKMGNITELKAGDIVARSERGYCFLRIILSEPSEGSSLYRWTRLTYCPDGKLYSIDTSCCGGASELAHDGWKVVGHIPLGVMPLPVAQGERDAA